MPFRKLSGKRDIAVEANVAYGEVKREAALYEDVNKMVTSVIDKGNYELTEEPPAAVYDFPVSPPVFPVYDTADKVIKTSQQQHYFKDSAM